MKNALSFLCIITDSTVSINKYPVCRFSHKSIKKIPISAYCDIPFISTLETLILSSLCESVDRRFRYLLLFCVFWVSSQRFSGLAASLTRKNAISSCLLSLLAFAEDSVFVRVFFGESYDLKPFGEIFV